jgi:hypothetical protein
MKLDLFAGVAVTTRARRERAATGAVSPKRAGSTISLDSWRDVDSFRTAEEEWISVNIEEEDG